MIILGIDPGSRRIGYGLIELNSGGVRLVRAGILSLLQKERGATLREIHKKLTHLIRAYSPRAVAIEKLFFAKNQKTAMQVAETRGVILLAVAQENIPLKEYGPKEVKLKITGYGAADKKAVAKMVKHFLRAPFLALPDDAMDALALALCAREH